MSHMATTITKKNKEKSEHEGHWIEGLSVAESRASLYENNLAFENAFKYNISSKFRSFRKVIPIESRCWLSCVAVVADYAAIHLIGSTGINELRLRMAGAVVGSGGGISLFDIEVGTLLKLITDEEANRPKTCICFSNPPADLRVGPLMAIGTTWQANKIVTRKKGGIHRHNSEGIREIEQGRLILKDLLTTETICDKCYPNIVTCVAIYEGMKGVSKRNKVFLNEKEFITAESILNATPMLPSIVLVGTANKVHVWPFESTSDEDLAVFADHTSDSIVSSVNICLAPSFYQNVLKSMIITGGTDGYLYVYDMKSLVRIGTMNHTCAVFAIASICIETAVVKGPSWMKSSPSKASMDLPSTMKKNNTMMNVARTRTLDTFERKTSTEEEKEEEKDDVDDDEEEGGGGRGPMKMLQRQSSSVSAAFANVDLMNTSSTIRPEQRMYAVSGGQDGKVCFLFSPMISTLVGCRDVNINQSYLQPNSPTS